MGAQAIPMVWDFVVAAGAFRVARVFHPTGPVPVLAAACLLLCPTVLVNGSTWAQCDVMYAAVLLFALEGVLRSRPRFTMVAFSVSLAIKLQAVFFAPALLTAFLARGWRLRWLLFAFLSYGPHMGKKWLPVAYASFLNRVGLVLVLRELSRRLGIGRVFAAASDGAGPDSRPPT